jgi:hypothetical protein
MHYFQVHKSAKPLVLSPIIFTGNVTEVNSPSANRRPGHGGEILNKISSPSTDAEVYQSHELMSFRDLKFHGFTSSTRKRYELLLQDPAECEELLKALLRVQAKEPAHLQGVDYKLLLGALNAGDLDAIEEIYSNPLHMVQLEDALDTLSRRKAAKAAEDGSTTRRKSPPALPIRNDEMSIFVGQGADGARLTELEQKIALRKTAIDAQY